MSANENAKIGRATIDAIGSDLVVGSTGTENARGADSLETKSADVFGALFYAYVDKAGINPEGMEICADLVDRCLDRAQMLRHPSLFGGWAGLAWVVTHLEVEDETIANEVDGFLVRATTRWPPRFGYDLIGGLVGVGVYFVERWPAESAIRGLNLLLDALESTAISTHEGTTWFTAPEHLPAWQRKKAPNGYFNLGTAHGVPGVCWLLRKLCESRIQSDRAHSLLRSTLLWLRSCQRDPTKANLPSWIAPGVQREPNRRIAWCYGPLGAGAVALEAAAAIGDTEGIDWALAMTRACADVAPEDAYVRDAGLCHGAAGNAQIFLRLSRHNDDAKFREAAQAWVQATLAYRTPGEGVGGYRMWGDVGGGGQAWLDDPSFLTGSAGVGLMLLAAMTDIEPNWDRLLLLS